MEKCKDKIETRPLNSVEDTRDNFSIYTSLNNETFIVTVV